MSDPVTDEQLVRWYNKGNIDAFEQLYARYKNAIYQYLFRQVESDGVADELHQDVWLKVIKSSSQFNQQSSFKTWLFKIAHNRLVDYYRQTNKQTLNLVQKTSVDKELKQDIGIEINLKDEPEMAMQTQQLKITILDAIASLPAEQKEVFLLHENSGLTVETIAHITHNSYESTKSRLRYAIKKLRQFLQQHVVVE